MITQCKYLYWRFMKKETWRLIAKLCMDFHACIFEDSQSVCIYIHHRVVRQYLKYEILSPTSIHTLECQSQLKPKGVQTKLFSDMKTSVKSLILSALYKLIRNNSNGVLLIWQHNTYFHRIVFYAIGKWICLFLQSYQHVKKKSLLHLLKTPQTCISFPAQLTIV